MSALSAPSALPAYAELRCLSSFSFLRGASQPDELVARAQALGYSALAITDECSMAGVVRAHVAAREHGLKLLVGSQFRVQGEPGFTLVLLATTLDAYGHLCEFITRLRRRSPKGSYRLAPGDIDGAALAGCLAIAVPDSTAGITLRMSAGSMPGADLTVATLFEPAMEGETLYEAKVGFVNNIAGLPDGPVPASAGKSSAAEDYALSKARKDALVSPALSSLKAIQLDYSGVEGKETGSDLPLAVHFRNEVKRYSGNTAEYDSWARVMAAQNERGALVELLKIKALDLAIQEKQYRQYESMEAQLASLVSLEVTAGGAQARTSQAASDAAKQNVKQSVK